MRLSKWWSAFLNFMKMKMSGLLQHIDFWAFLSLNTSIVLFKIEHYLDLYALFNV